MNITVTSATMIASVVSALCLTLGSLTRCPPGFMRSGMDTTATMGTTTIAATTPTASMPVPTPTGATPTVTTRRDPETDEAVATLALAVMGTDATGAWELAPTSAGSAADCRSGPLLSWI